MATIQIRDVPDDVDETIRRRARQAGWSGGCATIRRSTTLHVALTARLRLPLITAWRRLEDRGVGDARTARARNVPRRCAPGPPAG